MLRTVKDFASFFPGVCLILGYLCAMVATYWQPTVQLPERDVIAEWHDEHIGDIPRDRFSYEPDQGTKPVVQRMPALDEQGVPVLKQVPVAAGRGRPIILGEELKEVMLPKLSSPPFQMTRKQEHTLRSVSAPPFHLDGREVRPNEDKDYNPEKALILFHYTPNVQLLPTGVFERKHIVQYRTGIDPVLFSVIGTFIGTVVGIACIMLERRTA